MIAVLSICATNPVIDKYLLSKDYTVTILGTSNLHNWNETVGIVSGDGSVTWNADGSFDLDAINLKMQVNSIKSDMGSMMNNNTYKALKADNNPEIIFTLTEPIKSIKEGSGTTISAKGTLTIAGKAQPITMAVKVSIQNHNLLSFVGSQTIKMTDYGISPPTALLGTLRTGNEITINFKTAFTTAAN
jgi:polyisoprenoid-binding protein YceI